MVKNEILDAEELLRQAMIQGDVTTLDTLISDDLLFTNPEGLLVTKEMDLAGHRSGTMRLFTMSPSEQQIRECGDIAIVSVKMALTGTYAGTPMEGEMRYLRVWKKCHDSWQIIAGHCTPVMGIPC